MRGAINNKERAKQQIDYRALIFGNITPTDIDGLIEYKNKAYVIIELKYGNTPLLYGQRLALERLTDDLANTGKSTLCVIASHQIINPEIDVDIESTVVIEYRYKGKWLIPSHEYSPVAMIKKFLKDF